MLVQYSIHLLFLLLGSQQITGQENNACNSLLGYWFKSISPGCFHNPDVGLNTVRKANFPSKISQRLTVTAGNAGTAHRAVREPHSDHRRRLYLAFIPNTACESERSDHYAASRHGGLFRLRRSAEHFVR